MIEKCIRCNKPTPYDINYPVERRKYYIDGSGQLCQSCYEVLYVRGKGQTGEVKMGEGRTGEVKMEKKEQDEIEKDAKERLRAARKEKPLHRSDFSDEELEKLKVLAPEEYKLLK